MHPPRARLRRWLFVLLAGPLAALHASGPAAVTFTRVADATTLPPGGTSPFLNFSSLKVDRGWVVFEGRVQGAAGSGNGLYGWREGVLASLVTDQTPHPETGEPFWNNFGISGDNTVAIEEGVVVFAHQQSLLQAGIFQWSNGVISTLLWTNSTFGGVGRYVGGAVIGRSQGTNLIATRFGDPRSGLVAVPGDGDAIAYNFSADLPGLDVSFKTIGDAAFDRGYLVFWAGGAAKSVLYGWANGAFQTLADTRLVPPGWTSPISGFGRVAIDGDRVVFAAAGGDSQAGLFRVNRDGTGLVRLVDTQTTMPEGRPLVAPRLETWSFGAENGDVVFEAGDPFGEHGIYLWRNGALSRIVGNQGETLDGRRVAETDLAPDCLSEGTVVFQAVITSGRAIYLAHLPEAPLDPLAGIFEVMAAPASLRAWLQQTEEGRRLIALYDRHGAEMLRLALANTALRDQTLATLNDFLPGLIRFLAGAGTEATISAEQVARLNEVWDGYVAAASPALAADLTAERARFHDFAEFVGRSFVEWGLLLAIGVPDVPFVALSRPQRGDGTFRADANPVTGVTYRLQRAAPRLPIQWLEVPDAQIQFLGNRVEVLDPSASSDASLYRLSIAQ